MENATKPTAAEVKARKAQMLDHDIHVGLIMRATGEPKTAALFRAYCEGAAGLKSRLSPATEAPKRA